MATVSRNLVGIPVVLLLVPVQLVPISFCTCVSGWAEPPRDAAEDGSGETPSSSAVTSDEQASGDADGEQAALILPPKERRIVEPRSTDFWVEQLSHSQYLRREQATRELIRRGSEAVPEIVEVLKRGDLETVERALSIITEIALVQPPGDDDGAWGVLNDLASRTAGIRSSRAAASIEQVRSARAREARTKLTAAGIYVGVDDFVVRSMNETRMTIEIDDRWSGAIETLDWLRWLEGIEFARVEGTAVRAEVLEQLVRLPDLETLVILDATVDRRTLEPLKALPRISTLEFRYVKLTPELCDLIVSLPIRLSLNLMGTGVEEEKVEQMRQALPGLIIDHKQGGFLGVVCYDNNEICEISRIVEDSAAEAAGLKGGDVIIGIGDTEVTKFKDLQTAINQHLPGDEVEVRYVRGNQLQTVKLRLRRLEDK